MRLLNILKKTPALKKQHRIDTSYFPYSAHFYYEIHALRWEAHSNGIN